MAYYPHLAVRDCYEQLMSLVQDHTAAQYYCGLWIEVANWPKFLNAVTSVNIRVTKTPVVEPWVMAYAHNPSSWKADARGTDLQSHP